MTLENKRTSWNLSFPGGFEFKVRFGHIDEKTTFQIYTHIKKSRYH